MPSPFPGMDPYLERHWGDVHAGMIVYVRDQLQSWLPPDLRARLDERVYVDSEDDSRQVYPDIRVVEYGRRRKKGPLTAGNLALAEPFRIRLTDDPTTEGFIKIIDVSSGNRVVTIIELLSPSNKVPGPGQKLYQEKQQECRISRVSLVEIDLVRTGHRVMMVPEEAISESHRTSYQICVFRAWGRFLGEVYRVPLRERLPMIAVPLRKSDGDVPLDLQIALEQCYHNGRYDDGIDYNQDPIPLLNPDDARWADTLLREKGLRKRKSPRRSARNGKRRKAD